MDIVEPCIEDYTASLHARYDEPVLLEMEAEARERGFPIVGRNVGVTLWTLAASVGARRIFELGSGFGYSAYWFAKAAGSPGEIHLTDGDPENERKAAGYLGRVGVWNEMRYHVGDALTSFGSVDGEFDVVYDDIDKHGYPDAW
ncbi:MAG: class I SAM-dependent methyltransferase, partial [Actinomycetota bacterium]|nr:class I SAM-dependent methyltransferase [Actinomycetota bacterium]